jgi:hypothetical protein
MRVRFTLLAVAAVLVGGCGSGSKLPQQLPGRAEQLLTQMDVNRYPRGSPQRALLSWWRAMQFADQSNYVDSYVLPVRRLLQADPRMPQVLAALSGQLRTVRPLVRGAELRANRATIYTKVAYRTPVGSQRYVTSLVPKAFTLVLRQGRWRLVDDGFVQSSLPPLLRRKRS